MIQQCYDSVKNENEVLRNDLCFKNESSNVWKIIPLKDSSGNNIKELQRETIKNLYLGGGYYFQKYLEHRKHQSNQMKVLPNLFGLKNHS